MLQPNDDPVYDDPIVGSTESEWCRDDRILVLVLPDPDPYSFPAATMENMDLYRSAHGRAEYATFPHTQYPRPALDPDVSDFWPKYPTNCGFDASGAAGVVVPYNPYSAHAAGILDHCQPTTYQNGAPFAGVPTNLAPATAPTTAMERALSFRPRHIASNNNGMQNTASSSRSRNSAPTRKTRNLGGTERKAGKQRASQSTKGKQSVLDPYMNKFRAEAPPGQQHPKASTHAHRRDTKAVRERGACFKCRTWRKKVGSLQ